MAEAQEPKRECPDSSLDEVFFVEAKALEARRERYWRRKTSSTVAARAVEPPRVEIRPGLTRTRVHPWRATRHVAFAALSLLLAPVRHRGLKWAGAIAAVILAFWNVGPLRTTLQSAVRTASRPLQQRAAFLWEESFQKDLDSWLQPSALTPAAGAVRVQGLALHGRTMGMKRYEMNFAARVQRKSIGWVLCASGPDNHYVFKLIERGRVGETLRFDLVRYAVVDGRAPARSDRKTIPVVVRRPADQFLDISVRVSRDQIVTMVNGFGIDTWKEPEIPQGGLGFLAENGESFLVKSLTVSGNEDFLGLVLYGAEATLRSVKRNLLSLTATVHGSLS